MEKLTQFLIKWTYILIGNPRRHTLEERLFSTVSFLNGVTNIGGAFSMLGLTNALYLFWLHIITGILFLVLYYYSRFKSKAAKLFWPFVILMFGFLFINVLGNAGSMGGAHYYFVPALIIAIILSPNFRTSLLVFVLACAVSGVMFFLEWNYPTVIKAFPSVEERLVDVSGQFLFVQIFCGILVMILARSYDQEREKSDQLLLNILPKPIADELKQTDRVEPLLYQCTTVIFTDFVGFTKIAEKLSPNELIAELDQSFSRFDQVIKKHNLEKIKTMGDAYMAVGGIPNTNPTHAIDAVLAALEIRQIIEEFKTEKQAANQPYWELRLGIHSGHLVAGIVGRQKFAYDVWGDTVNTASRLESSGVPGKVNISAATYEMVKEFFICTSRGKVSAKNKGEIEMYFVERIKPELSADNDGLQPNEKFHELSRKKRSQSTLSEVPIE